MLCNKSYSLKYGNYSKLNLLNTTSLRSKYAKALYELIELYKYKGQVTISEEKLKTLLKYDVKNYRFSYLLREIDKGLANSRIGIVLVTRSFLKRIQGNGVADKELSALLSRDQLIPVLDGVTFEEIRDISPLLGSRSGLTTAEETMENIAAQLSEVATV